MKRFSKYQQFAALCAVLLNIPKPRVWVLPKSEFRHRDIPKRAIIGSSALAVDGICDIVIAGRNPNWLWTIAHEMTHAYMEANHPRATAHGKTFQRMASKLRVCLKDVGYSLSPLYRKGIDE